MTLRRGTREERASSYPSFSDVLVIAVAIMVLIEVLTIVFGINRPVPTFTITPDPAGLLPF